MVARRVTGHRRRRRHRRPRPRRRRPGRPRLVRHRHPLGRHRRLRLAARRARSRSTCSGPPASPARSRTLGVTPHLVAVSTCYVAGNRAGRRPRSRSTTARSSSTSTGGREVDGARRARADAEAESRTPEALAAVPQARPAASWARPARPLLAAKTEQRRQALGQGPHGRRRPGPGRRRSAGPTPTPTPRRSASGRCSRSGATCRSRSCGPSIIESALAEPRPGWIRGFRMAEPVIICYARGLLKEFPGVPEGIVDVIPVDLVVARDHRRRRRRTARRDARRSSRWRRARPTRCATAHSSTSCASWFTEHPLYDSEGQPIVVPDWSFPGRGRVQGQLERAKTLLERAETVLQSLPLRGKQAEWSATARGDAASEAERALGYVELYGAYAECEAIYGVDRLLAAAGALDAGRPGRVLLRPPGHRLGHLRPRGPPAVGRRARPGAHHARRAHGRGPRRPPAPPGPRPRPPPRRLRPREHAHRLERGRVVLVAGHPAPAPRRPAALRRSRRWPRRRRCWRSTAATAATSSATSTAATRAPRRPARRGRRRDVQPPDPHQVVPGRPSAGCASTARSATAPCSSPARSTSSSSRSRPLFDDIVCARLDTRARRHVPGRADRRPAHRRGPGPGAGRLRRRQRLRPGRGGRLRRLDHRPADARGGRLPGGGQPRDPPGRPRPQAGLAGRALRRRPTAPPSRRCPSARAWHGGGEPGLADPGPRRPARATGDRR